MVVFGPDLMYQPDVVVVSADIVDLMYQPDDVVVVGFFVVVVVFEVRNQSDQSNAAVVDCSFALVVVVSALSTDLVYHPAKSLVVDSTLSRSTEFKSESSEFK